MDIKSGQMDEPGKRLSAAEARAKAIECREMAKRAGNPEHQTMLEHIAETWERIASTLVHNGG